MKRAPWLLSSTALLVGATAAAQYDGGAVVPPPPPPRWPAVAARARVIATPFRGVVALAVADLDGDRRAELLLATPLRVHVARLRERSLVFVGDAQGASLAVLGVHPAPLREPLGAMAPDPSRAAVWVRTSAVRALGEVTLSGSRVVVTARAGADVYPTLGGGFARLAARGDRVATRALDPFAAGVGDTVVEGPMNAAFPAWHASGVSAWADGAGRASLRRAERPAVTLADVAPPLVLDDLDVDGQPELFAASASAPGAADRVRVFTVTEAGVRERAGIAVPGPLQAMASGDLDGDGAPELVAASRDPERGTTTLHVIP